MTASDWVTVIGYLTSSFATGYCAGFLIRTFTRAAGMVR